MRSNLMVNNDESSPYQRIAHPSRSHRSSLDQYLELPGSTTRAFHASPSPSQDFIDHSHSHRRDSQDGSGSHTPDTQPKGLPNVQPDFGYGASSSTSQERRDVNPARRQSVPLSWSGSSQSILKLSTIKKNAEKKQTLACLFCRERKIACGRPLEGSDDHTCK